MPCHHIVFVRKVTKSCVENGACFFKNNGHFFSIFREEERKKRKNAELKRNEKKKNLIRYFANHKEIITFAAYNL